MKHYTRLVLCLYCLVLFVQFTPFVGAAEHQVVAVTQKLGPIKLKPKLVQLRPILKVQQFSGEMARWVTAKPLETMETQPTRFAWQNPLSHVVSAHWQLSDMPIRADYTSLDAPGTLATGSCPVPETGKGKIFNIDLSKYLPSSPPAKPKKYYIRLVAFRTNKKIPIVSNSVTITYLKPSGEITEFTAEGLELTVKQKYAWMYKNSPMPIQIDLEKLDIGNSNEGADEPYLIVFVIYVDGTTINPLDFASSTVRIDCPGKTHGNVPDEDVWGKDLTTGTVANIPASTGHFEKSIKPIGLEFAADLPDYDGSIGQSMKDNTVVYLVVVAMEEDATSTSAMNEARAAALQALQARVNGVIQSLTLQDLMKGQPPEFDVSQLQSEIKDVALEAAEDETMNRAWSIVVPILSLSFFAEVIDRDDYVGAAYKKFTFGELLDANPPAAIPFSLTLSNSDDWEGSYTVRGWIRRK